MGEENMRKPEILVFAWPNGSGKSTITQNVDIVGEYINADDIKKAISCTDLEAAKIATAKRESLLKEGKEFTFETVLSSSRNLELLKRAKEQGYFIKCFYVLTNNPYVNEQRVQVRVKQGGHDVPTEKIIMRYYRCINLLPELINTCDVIHIYDNTIVPFRIFKKRKEQTFIWPSAVWTERQIKKLIGSEN